MNIDGGDGNDILTVILTEFPDQVVITSDGVFGAGLNISFNNVEILEADGMEGDDTFYVLSSLVGVTVRLIGNLGSDTFIIAGDIIGTVVSKDAAGDQVIFPNATHDTGAIEGTIIIDAGITDADRALSDVFMLPWETNNYIPWGTVTPVNNTTVAYVGDDLTTKLDPSYDAVLYIAILNDTCELLETRKLFPIIKTMLSWIRHGRQYHPVLNL